MGYLQDSVQIGEMPIKRRTKHRRMDGRLGLEADQS